MSDLEIPKGTSWAAEWPVVDEAGDAVDVSLWDVWAQVRPTKTSSVKWHEWSKYLGNAEAGDGFVRLIVTHEESAGWTWDSGFYDVLLTSPGGERTRLDEGQVTVDITVTRDDSDSA